LKLRDVGRVLALGALGCGFALGSGFGDGSLECGALFGFGFGLLG
jgi:hypothetical protein